MSMVDVLVEGLFAKGQTRRVLQSVCLTEPAALDPRVLITVVGMLLEIFRRLGKSGIVGLALWEQNPPVGRVGAWTAVRRGRVGIREGLNV